MKKYGLFFLLVLLGTNKSISQKRELGNVTIEELNEKFHPKDSSAVAAVIYQIGETKFLYSQNDGFKLVTQIDTKIKIYKKEGYDFGNVGYSFYKNGSTTEKILFSKVNTYNLVNGKIEKSKIKSDGEFTDKKNENWSVKKITFPDVKEGSIIEYRVEITSPFYTNFPKWNFQKNIPVNYSEYATIIPEYFTYNANLKGFLSPSIKEENKANRIVIDSKERGSQGTMFSSDRIEYIDVCKTYKVVDAPALKDESFVNNIENYTSSIIHELSGTKFPNSNYQSYANNWETVVKEIYKDEDFGSELNKDNYFENDLKLLLEGLTVKNEKIEIIFNYVKSRMNWNGNYGYYCSDGVKKAYQNKTGNVGEINLMLVAMLKYANIDANPILLSTRSNGISFFPSRTAFDYVIAGVDVDNEIILLDATNKYAAQNILPIRDLNWIGRMIRKDGSSTEIDLMPKKISKEVTNFIGAINNDAEIAGRAKRIYFDYDGFVFRDRNVELSNQTYIEKLEKKFNNIEISELVIDNKTQLDLPVSETFTFKTNNSIEKIGDKMYFSPMLFFAQKENPFKSETREYPIDFVYPDQERYLLNITIPEGYVVESLPKSVSMSLSNNNGGIKYLVSNDDASKIQVSLTFEINTSIFAAEYYPELKAFFAEKIKIENEKIVLKKI
ncbi:DUF3857 domain-containing protein [Flavobacterium sp.]|uniref:DUF3857 domain-containing protein n=1 Tax=Flavobacterium sp. TaxID=239 RepID=UPI0037506C25